MDCSETLAGCRRDNWCNALCWNDPANRQSDFALKRCDKTLGTPALPAFIYVMDKASFSGSGSVQEKRIAAPHLTHFGLMGRLLELFSGIARGGRGLLVRPDHRPAAGSRGAVPSDGLRQPNVGGASVPRLLIP